MSQTCNARLFRLAPNLCICYNLSDEENASDNLLNVNYYTSRCQKLRSFKSLETGRE